MIVAPIQLGCCPDEPRCRLCVPRPPVTPALVDALIETITDERGSAPDRVVFFGGAPPDDALLDAAGGLPVEVRVRPDLLDRATARHLVDRGVQRIELDALTFHTPSLRAIDRPYAGPRVVTMAEALRDQGIEVGLVLSIGLPAHSHAEALADAHQARALASTVRIHPVLVVHGSGLWRAHLEGLYEPLRLGQTVTTVRAMLDVLEPGVRVIRVGQQPGPDGLGRVVAGPRHSSLREVVESRRTLDRLRTLLREADLPESLVIRCATADETRTRGPHNDNVRTLRAEFALREVVVHADPTLQRGTFVLEAS